MNSHPLVWHASVHSKKNPSLRFWESFWWTLMIAGALRLFLHCGRSKDGSLDALPGSALPKLFVDRLSRWHQQSRDSADDVPADGTVAQRSRRLQSGWSASDVGRVFARRSVLFRSWRADRRWLGLVGHREPAHPALLGPRSRQVRPGGIGQRAGVGGAAAPSLGRHVRGAGQRRRRHFQAQRRRSLGLERAAYAGDSGRPARPLPAAHRLFSVRGLRAQRLRPRRKHGRNFGTFSLFSIWN